MSELWRLAPRTTFAPRVLLKLLLWASICRVGPWVAPAVAAGSPTLAAVVNAASYRGASIAPGEMVTLFGSGMGPASLVGASLDPSGKVSSTAAGTRVLFDGTPSPILYTSSGQVSVVVPYSVAGHSATQVQVEYLGVRSDPLPIAVAPSMPGIFTSDSSGKGQGAVLNQDNSLNSSLHPAVIGSVAILYATGEGQTDPPGDDGRLAAGLSLPKPLLPVSVTMSGLPAQVLYAGAAPGQVAGFLQVNVLVPVGVATGNAPVVLTVGGTPSQSGVTLAVSANSFPGPVSFLNGADGKGGSISPCSIATIVAPDVAPELQGFAAPGWVGALPYQLAKDSVSFSNYIQSPMLNVANIGGRETISVQVPCELPPGDNVLVTVSNAAGSAMAYTKVLPASPGIFETVMSDGQERAVLVRPDGSFVSLVNPARTGETIRLFTTGLGPTSPATVTGSLPTPGADSLVLGQVIVGVNNAGTQVLAVRAAPTLIGVYTIDFRVPFDAPAGNDVVLAVAVNPPSGGPTLFSNSSKIPIVGGTTNQSNTAQEVKAGSQTLHQGAAPSVSIQALTPTSLSKVSGDQQTTVVHAAFAAPLVVQVSSGLSAVPGYTVQFATSGSAPTTLSVAAAVTDSDGRARTSVTAGAIPGRATVTASIPDLKLVQTFDLTVVPQGPAVNGTSFYNGADFTRGAISPCGITTIIASGLAPAVKGYAAGSVVGALPYVLANARVTINSIAAPILNVANVGGQESMVVQVPCEVAPGVVPVTVNVNGGASSVTTNVTPASPGIFGTVMSDGKTRAVLARPDGSFVSLQNPARRGELVRMYATGLGPTVPAITTNSLPYPGIDSLVLSQVIVGVNNTGVGVVTARADPDRIGVYEIAFRVPSDAPTGNDIVLSMAVNVPGDSQTRFSGGNNIPIQ